MAVGSRVWAIEVAYMGRWEAIEARLCAVGVEEAIEVRVYAQLV